MSERNTTEYTAEAREIAELELAASAIHDELLRRAALLKRRCNSSRWIYRLPLEVFTEILMLDIMSSGAERRGIGSFRRRQPSPPPEPPRRAELCHVSHLFLQTILGTPRLWSDIQWGRDNCTRCLQMSAQAPLSIRCSELDQAGNWTSVAAEEFLRAICEHSGRWKTVSLKFRFGTRWLQFLEVDAPHLRDLTVDSRGFEQGHGGMLGEYEPGPSVIKISGRPSLRNISLFGPGLQWNDFDLSRLRSLTLSQVQEGAPSVEKLIETLRVASGLRRLALHQVNIINSNGEQHMEPQLIHLPALLALWLDELPAGLTDYLITVIRSPRLKFIRVRRLPLKHLDNPSSDQNPYHHFFQVLIPALAFSTAGIVISNETSSNVVYARVRSLSIHQSWLWLKSGNAERSADFGVEAEDSLRAVQQMVKFITSNAITVPLTILANGCLPDPNAVWPTTPSFPAEVLGKLPTVTTVSASGLADAVSILTFLGDIRRDEETGRLGWACPQLEHLKLSLVDGLTSEHCQTFLDARYGDGNPLLVEGEIVQRPPMVAIDHPISWG
ncbi:hypothetical protein FRC04_009383 [Tulasnella sp. 424]|nr:hypothetical protein FRC04_009383 [Tulasnella sp. 424]